MSLLDCYFMASVADPLQKVEADVKDLIELISMEDSHLKRRLKVLETELTKGRSRLSRLEKKIHHMIMSKQYYLSEMD